MIRLEKKRPEIEMIRMIRLEKIGKVLEWLKRPAWKASKR